jgi:GDP-L-fucose synthase
MPTNLYGPGDNYHPENSHVIPALIRRFHEAKVSRAPEVVIWGNGTPRREFLYVDDLADAAVFVMELEKSSYDSVTQPMQSFINVGFGGDITISDLAKAVAKVAGYEGEVRFDISKPGGTPRKLIDSVRLNNIGWKPKVNLENGLVLAYADFCKKKP